MTEEKLNFPIEKCDCECHNDGRIRHTKDDICCKKPEVMCASQPCQCQKDDEWHVACAISPHFTVGKAQITDIKSSYPQMKHLQKYTGCIAFGYDPNTKSLDIHFQRSDCEWDYGAGIQINNLTESDKEALRKYLEKGE
ncbi:hypothetical protein [Nitrosopumilus sp.]|uniref:hypothetical protein n=1 Tax=Nitrosopumilus sp. TaxID=2024843 RepID=UPI003D14B281